MKHIQVNNLDFENIKTTLKDYLRAQTDFTDYDFEGSVWSTLLDVLAYNTYYTAFNTNMVVNELFLESATLRDNVISLAKQLGYKPKSVVSAKAMVNFQVNFVGSAPAIIILKKGTGFVTTFNDKLYRFVVLDDYKAGVVNGQAFFTNVELYEGSVVQDNFTVSNIIRSQQYILSNGKADSSTIRVKIYPTEESSEFSYFTMIDNIVDIKDTDGIFYVDETDDERYELFFGDGVIGQKLEDNNYVEASYLISNGAEANGASLFVFSGVLEDTNGTAFPTEVRNITVVDVANGGADIESIDKIKFNAPKLYATQNRAVTSSDYAAIVRKIYPAISDIITYGGEQERYPEFGKVKIVIKPDSGATLSTTTKQQIIAGLKDYAVASVTPEIKDPSILYLELESRINFNTRITNQFPEDIRTKVFTGVEQYTKASSTEKFNGKFRYSKYIGVIDSADRSITSNTTTVKMRKDFYPLINSTSYYELCFQNPFKSNCLEDGPVIQSTAFRVSEYPITDVYMEDRLGKMILYRLDPGTGEKIVLKDYIGDVDYDEGEIKLYDVTIIQGTFFDNRISVRVVPRNNDIDASRHMYLDVDVANSKFAVYPE
jgi:hypothetical protein